MAGIFGDETRKTSAKDSQCGATQGDGEEGAYGQQVLAGLNFRHGGEFAEGFVEDDRDGVVEKRFAENQEEKNVIYAYLIKRKLKIG